jgi:hypothetical protein
LVLLAIVSNSIISCDDISIIVRFAIKQMY